MSDNLAELLIDRFAAMAAQNHNQRAEIERLKTMVDIDKVMRAETDRLQAHCNRLTEANESLTRKQRESEPVLTALYEAADQVLKSLKDPERQNLASALKKSEKFIDIIPF
jgi:uncharacterized Fe-S cluster-containing protein